MTELALGRGIVSGDVWKLGYEYGELQADGTVNTAKNTGNIAKQTLSFNGLANPFVQTYKYDSLYRLTEAKETNNGNQTWKQNFSYDRYGNRTGFTQDIGGQQLQINNLTLPTVDTATNRFNANQGYLYDKNGNLKNDPVGGNRQFIFNGDNKQKEVRDASNNLIGEYFYDGEGKRVKKVTDLETTVFVYSSGKLIAEYSTATPPQNPTTSWTVTDQLGSPRVLVNSLGDVVSRRDFMPFGEEIAPDGTHRTTNLKYNLGDNVRQKFTGYQKDSETGLDFAEARMYENRLGRFTAVDPLLASGKSANPQTFNRYVYVGNNPIITTDPTGLDWFRKYNSETKKWEFNEIGGDGWESVGDADYITVSNWCWGEDCGEEGKRTGYLYKSGGWDRGERANYGFTSAMADTGIGGAKWGWNSMAFISNSFYRVLEQPSPFAGSWDPSRIIHRTPYWEATNQTQANAQLAMTGVSLYFGAASSARPQPISITGLTTRSSSNAVGISMDGLAYQTKFLEKHIENSPKSLNLLKSENVQVFPNKEVLGNVESAIFSRGQYTGNIRGWDRYGVQFSKPIGTQINTNGQRIFLFYGEMKLRDNLYHIIPRIGPSKP